MAIQTQIINWIDSVAERIDLRVIEESWTDQWIPEVKSFTASVDINGCRYIGYGIDCDPELALVKAIVESIERSVKDYNGIINSSGIAGHATFRDASFKAQCELIERDAFFCHYLSRSAFQEVVDPMRFLDESVDGQRVMALLHSVGVKLVFGRLVVPMGYFGCICVALGDESLPRFGVVIGLGCHRSEAVAMRHALLECIPNVIAFLEGRSLPSITVKEFTSHRAPGVHEHLQLGFCPDSAPIMKKLFASSAGAGRPVSMKKFSVESLLLPDVVQCAPLKFVRASAPNVQVAYFGKRHEKKLNIGRISEFCGCSIRVVDLESYPHCLG